MQSFLTDFIDCVNAFQRHPQCTQKYCKRVRKGKVICRFGFPIKLKNISKFECLLPLLVALAYVVKAYTDYREKNSEDPKK